MIKIIKKFFSYLFNESDYRETSIIGEEFLDESETESNDVNERLITSGEIKLLNVPDTSKISNVRIDPKYMSVSDKCLTLVSYYEGFSESAYRDIVGKLTIGYGFTKGVKEGDVITKAEANSRLIRELNEHASIINEHVKVKLHQWEYDALASFIYNVGVGAFGKSTLLRKLNKGDYEGAARELLRWNRAGGVIVNGLTRRRKSEKFLFETGELNYYEGG